MTDLSPLDSYKSQIYQNFKDLVGVQDQEKVDECCSKIDEELTVMVNDPKLKDYFDQHPDVLSNIFAAQADFKAVQATKDIGLKSYGIIIGEANIAVAFGEVPKPFPGPIPYPQPIIPPFPEPKPFPGPIPPFPPVPEPEQPIVPVPEPEQPIVPVPEPEQPIVPPGPTGK
jgi:hypothetical protein